MQHSYIKFRIKKKTLQEKKMSQVKPLLFLAKGGTMGDLKPLAILAVIAARTSKTKVTFVYRLNTQFLFLDQLAQFMLGDNYKDFLDIVPMEPVRQRHSKIIETKTNDLFDLSSLDQYFSFGQIADSTSLADYSVKLDFGDNGQSKNRFVSCLLSAYRPFTRHFGSLYLPSKLTWSSSVIMEQLQDFKFKNQEKKIMVIAGSMQLPFSYYELFTWFEKNEEFKYWGFILVGYNDVNKTTSDYYASEELMEKYFHHNQVFILKDYVEYEDLVKYADFFISNCGAGSVLVPLVAGVAQTCDWIEHVSGEDKKSNLRSISFVHHVGPGKLDNFPNLMKDLEVNLNVYTENALKCSRIVKNETEIMLENMSRFFELLSMDADLQKHVIATGMIPLEFALPDCSLETIAKKVKY
jgi:hypothetical protein